VGYNDRKTDWNGELMATEQSVGGIWTLLWNSYISRLFVANPEGWLYTPYRSGELVQIVTDEQHGALLGLYRKLFVSQLALEIIIVALLVLTIPAVALHFADGVDSEEAQLASNAAIATAALYFGWVIASVTYQVTRTRRILGRTDFVAPRPDRHEISRQLSAQYTRVWRPYARLVNYATLLAAAVMIGAMIAAWSATTQEGEPGAPFASLYLYISAQLAAFYALWKYLRHRRQMRAASTG